MCFSFVLVSQDILADDGVGGEEERRKRLFKGLKFFFGREVGQRAFGAVLCTSRSKHGNVLERLYRDHLLVVTSVVATSRRLLCRCS